MEFDSLKAGFGTTVAAGMGWSADAAADLAEQLLIERTERSLTLTFAWCGRSSTVDAVEDDDLGDAAAVFAGDVVDDLKEHRGRDGTVLPWGG